MRSSPGQHCTAEATRQGESVPCGRVAVAVAVDEDDQWYPVCKGHARGRPLLPLLEAARWVVQSA